MEKFISPGAYLHYQLEIAQITETMKVFVTNPTYDQAIEILDKSRFVVISGNPGVGKTTLANAIVFHHITDGYNFVSAINDIEEAFKGIGRLGQDEKAIILYDDFLGRSSSSEKLHKNEDASLVKLIKYVTKSTNKKLIFTTREYILQEAEQFYEKLANLNLEKNKQILKIEDFDDLNKAHILYNHLRKGGIDKKYLQDFVSNKTYRDVIDHANYTPRIVEWFTHTNNLTEEELSNYSVVFLDGLNNPKEIWDAAFTRHLNDTSRKLLLCLYSSAGYIEEEKLRKFCLSIWKISNAEFNDSLRSLERSFINIAKSSWSQTINITFHNPSISDYLSHAFISNRYRELFIDIVSNLKSCRQASYLWDHQNSYDWYDNEESETKIDKTQIRSTIKKYCLPAFIESACKLVEQRYDSDLKYKHILMLLKIHRNFGGTRIIDVCAKEISSSGLGSNNSSHIGIALNYLKTQLSRGRYNFLQVNVTKQLIDYFENGFDLETLSTLTYVREVYGFSKHAEIMFINALQSFVDNQTLEFENSNKADDAIYSLQLIVEQTGFDLSSVIYACEDIRDSLIDEERRDAEYGPQVVKASPRTLKATLPEVVDSGIDEIFSQLLDK